jgi:hypothetical protein
MQIQIFKGNNISSNIRREGDARAYVVEMDVVTMISCQRR